MGAEGSVYTSNGQVEMIAAQEARWDIEEDSVRGSFGKRSGCYVRTGICSANCGREAVAVGWATNTAGAG